MRLIHLAVLPAFWLAATASAEPKILDAGGLKGVHIKAKSGELQISANTDRMIEADLTDPTGTVEIVDGFLEVKFEKGYAEIRIPLKSNLIVETDKASVELSGRYGVLGAKNGTGDVSLSIEANEANIVVGNGGISMAGICDHLTLENRSGDILVQGIADTVKIKSVSGEVLVERPPRELEVANGAGRVTLNGRLESRSTVTIQTESGLVTITAGGSEGYKVNATSESGVIRFPEAAPQKSKASFTKGKGSSEIKITTVSGNVNVED